MGKSVLVTGWAGYIGPVVVLNLKRAGWFVTGIDTEWFRAAHPEELPAPDLEYRADIRADWLLRADAVVHLAGLSNDPLGDLHPNLTTRINYQSTIDLIRRLPDARHVFVSSCSVYGANALATEESPTNPLTAYAKSKAMVDFWLHGEGADPRNAVSLRLGTVYGYSPGHRLDLVVNKMVHDAVTGKPITATGNAARPLTNILDVASAIEWALASKERGVFNVVGENWRIRDLAHEVASFTGAPIKDNGRDFDQRDYMATTDKIRAEGWAPRHTVAGTLPVLAERSINLPPGEYRRLPVLQALIADGALTSTLDTGLA